MKLETRSDGRNPHRSPNATQLGHPGGIEEYGAGIVGNGGGTRVGGADTRWRSVPQSWNPAAAAVPERLPGRPAGRAGEKAFNGILPEYR